MEFGPIDIARAEGAILAHSLRLDDGILRKGRVLSATDTGRLARAGFRSVIGAVLGAGDLHEDEAARRIAAAVAGAGVVVGEAFTGRCNLYAAAAGVVDFDPAALNAVNRIDEAITLATLPADQRVERRQMVGTVKIIPYGVGQAQVEAAERIICPLADGRLGVARFEPAAVALVQTRLAGTREAILDKTRASMERRLAACGSVITTEARCDHTVEAIAAAIHSAVAAGCDLVLVSGASATTDRRDVVPAGIEAAGGVVDRVGMPVDPGNLLVLGRVRDRKVPVLGLPGCARSPAINGLDLVLHRLLAGLPVHPQHIQAMGVGGLLKGVPGYRSFRTDRESPATTGGKAEFPRAPRIAAVILAAGESRRMGAENKLLMAVDGEPLVRGVVATVLASQAEPVIVVTGHQAAEVRAALQGLAVRITENPAPAAGLSASIRIGIDALPADADGVLVCLGDMPWVTESDLNRLIAAHSEEDGRLICVPTWQGRRGNPVLWSRRYFGDLKALEGDRGARNLLDAQLEAMCEVAMAGDGVRRDIDTAGDLEQATRRGAGFPPSGE